MFLQQILAQLDAELQRLTSLRQIVAGLSRVIRPVSGLESQADLQGKTETVKPDGRQSLRRKTSVSRLAIKLPKLATAAEAIPVAKVSSAGVIVVSAQQLALERELRAVQAALATQPLKTSSEMTARDLSARWLGGLNTSNGQA